MYDIYIVSLEEGFNIGRPKTIFEERGLFQIEYIDKTSTFSTIIDLNVMKINMINEFVNIIDENITYRFQFKNGITDAKRFYEKVRKQLFDYLYHNLVPIDIMTG